MALQVDWRLVDAHCLCVAAPGDIIGLRLSGGVSGVDGVTRLTRRERPGLLSSGHASAAFFRCQVV
jgi:hypothetical protein